MGEMRINIEDDGLLVKLSDLAKENNRTLDEEVIHLLRQATQISEVRESLYQAAVRISAMTPKGIKQMDSVEMLREDRDR